MMCEWLIGLCVTSVMHAYATKESVMLELGIFGHKHRSVRHH